MSNNKVISITQRRLKADLPNQIDKILNEAFSDVMAEPSPDEHIRSIVASESKRKEGYLNRYSVLDSDNAMSQIEAVDEMHPDFFGRYQQTYPDAVIILKTHSIKIRETMPIKHPNKEWLARHNPNLYE